MKGFKENHRPLTFFFAAKTHSKLWYNKTKLTSVESASFDVNQPGPATQSFEPIGSPHEKQPGDKS